jgi:signal transduction histidine kinase
MKNIDINMEFIFQMIEDIQDLAKFNNNQKFTLQNEYFNVREFLNDVIVLFEEQCKFKGIELIKEVESLVP